MALCKNVCGIKLDLLNKFPLLFRPRSCPQKHLRFPLDFTFHFNLSKSSRKHRISLLLCAQFVLKTCCERLTVNGVICNKFSHTAYTFVMLGFFGLNRLLIGSGMWNELAESEKIFIFGKSVDYSYIWLGLIVFCSFWSFRSLIILLIYFNVRSFENLPLIIASSSAHINKEFTIINLLIFPNLCHVLLPKDYGYIETYH